MTNTSWSWKRFLEIIAAIIAGILSVLGAQKFF